MALEAACVLRRGGAQLFGEEPAVRIMAIAATDQPFIYAMVKWLYEVGFGFQVAAIAQLGLGVLQQALTGFGAVGGVAINATYTLLLGLGAEEVAVLFTELMAIETLPAGFFRLHFGEGKNLGDIATRLDVFLPRTVAGLTSLPGRSAARVQRGLKVWRASKGLELLFVAGLALIGAGVLRGVGAAMIRLLFRRRRFALLVLGNEDIAGKQADRKSNQGAQCRRFQMPHESPPPRKRMRKSFAGLLTPAQAAVLQVSGPEQIQGLRKHYDFRLLAPSIPGTAPQR